VSKENGFLPLRRGLWEHVRDGRMTITEALAFIYICSQADTRNGIWKGSAKSLSGELGIPERTARDVLEKMEHGDYIRRFAVPGRHVCYPILIHKFPISQGEHNGEHLNALESSRPADLAYFSREHGVEQDGVHGAAQRILDTGDKRRTRAAKSVAPADPRYQPFVDSAFESFSRKHGQPPTWGDRDFANLKSLLGKNKSLTLAELRRRWTHYLSSTEPFTVKQGGSLAYFCTHFDSFMAGPILERTGGKPDASALESRNLVAAGFQPLN
jgi:hypothetical protein